jgi:hypothetical protein
MKEDTPEGLDLDIVKKAPAGKFRVIGADCWRGIELYHAGDFDVLEAAVTRADEQDDDFTFAEAFDETGASVHQTPQLRKRELAAVARKKDDRLK